MIFDHYWKLIYFFFAISNNRFAPSSVTADKLNTTWLYEALVDKWGSYLTEEAKSTLRERGEFSMLIRPGLRVITLNTNVAYKYNW